MKKTQFELIKKLLLLREAGAYDSVDEALSMAIDIYCELNEAKRAAFIEELTKIYHIAWDNYWDDLTTWPERQDNYRYLLNGLYFKEGLE